MIFIKTFEHIQNILLAVMLHKWHSVMTSFQQIVF